MLKSLQVLRIHLLELEKVNELCKDFCTRYISCLRGKLNSENIMRTLNINQSPPMSPVSPIAPNPTASSSSQLSQTDLVSHLQSQVDPIASGSNADGGLLTTFQQEKSDGFSTLKSVSSDDSTSNEGNLDNRGHCMDTPTMSLNDLTCGFLSKKGKSSKRGVLPKQATNVLKAWLFQHLVVSDYGYFFSFVLEKPGKLYKSHFVIL